MNPSLPHEIFPKAPIVEALLDIQVSLKDDVEFKDMEQIHDKIKEKYPDKKEQRFFSGGIIFKENDTPSAIPTSSGVKGFFFYSPEKDKIVQSRIDGFTFNKLKPYEHWEAFRDEAKQLWQIYCECTPPQQVLRVALRYINRIEVSMPLGDFSEYLLTSPQIAPNLPQELSNFLMRIEIPHTETNSHAVITQTMEAPTENNQLPLILDIDIFEGKSVTGDFDVIWDDFEQLHDLKNEIFFNSLTDKAKELFR